MHCRRRRVHPLGGKHGLLGLTLAIAARADDGGGWRSNAVFAESTARAPELTRCGPKSLAGPRLALRDAAELTDDVRGTAKASGCKRPYGVVSDSIRLGRSVVRSARPTRPTVPRRSRPSYPFGVRPWNFSRQLVIVRLLPGVVATASARPMVDAGYHVGG